MLQINPAVALKHIQTLAPICQQANNWTPLFAYLGGLQNEGTASKATVIKKAAAATGRIRKTATGGNNVNQLLNYFRDHPTASWTQAQLREVSPFKNWRPNILGATISRLMKSGQLVKNGAGYQIGNVDRTLNRGGARQRKPAAAAGAPQAAAAA